MVGKTLKIILKVIFITVILGILTSIGKSLYELWKNRRGAK